MPNTTLVFHRADGSVSSTQTTDGDGRVETTITAGAMVTVPLSTSPVNTLATLAGLEPGDDLVFREPETLGPIALGTAAVTLPGDLAGAVRYVVDTGCDRRATTDGSLGTVLNVQDTCTTSGNTFHVVATAYDSSDELVAYSALLDNTVGTDVDVTLPAWSTELKIVPVTIENAPVEAPAAGAARLLAYIDEIGFAVDSLNIGFFGNGTSHIDVALPGIAEGFYGALGVFYGSGITTQPDSLAISFHDRKTQIPGEIRLDASAGMLPRIYDYALDTTDPARPVVSFASDRPLEPADLTVYVLATASHYWLVAAPPTREAFRYPELPDELAELRPNANASAIHEMIVADSDYVADFDEIRQVHGLGFLLTLSDTPPPNPTGADTVTEVALAGSDLASEL